MAPGTETQSEYTDPKLTATRDAVMLSLTNVLSATKN